MNKGIFIDLDGTLLNDNYKISRFDVDIINKMKLANYKIYLITGKAMHHALDFYDQLQLNTWLITSAGQVISQGKKVVWQKILNYKKIYQLIFAQDLLDIVLDFIIQTNKTIYASNLNSQIIKLFYEQGVEIKQYDKNIVIKKPVGLYLNLQINNQINKWEIIKKFNEKWQKWFEFHPWEMMRNIFIVHVVPAKINKWSAIKKIKKWDHLNHIIAFGNGRNDIPILKNADVSFAMKNSTDEVKFYANQITEFNNNHSGVGKACLKLLKNQDNQL